MDQPGICPECGQQVEIDTEYVSGFWDGEGGGGFTYDMVCPECDKKLVSYVLSGKPKPKSCELIWKIRKI